MTRLCLVLACLLGGCTFTWNGDTPALPVTGSPPALSSLERLSTVLSGRATLMTGVDGAPWAAFCEYSSGGVSSARSCKRMRLVRIDDTRASEVVDGDGFALHGTELYVQRDAADLSTRTLTLHHPGGDDDATFDVAPGRSVVTTNASADVFLYWAEDATPPSWTVYRRDRAYQRDIVIPASVQGDGKGDRPVVALTDDGSVVVVRDPLGATTAYATLDETSVSLGQRPADLAVTGASLVTWGTDGIRSVALDGSGERVLFAAPLFDRANVTLFSGVLYHAAADGLRRVPLDGSRADELVQQLDADPDHVRARAVSADGRVVYSLDTATRYVGGAGDGWIGDSKVVQRGRFLRFSADGARLHFLEHSATLGTYGDLTTATSPGEPNRTLAINVHAWDELPDGRLVAIENEIQPGTWNRLVLIDEAASTKNWLCPSTSEFFVVPGGEAVVCSVVTGALGFGVYRAPVPLR